MTKFVDQNGVSDFIDQNDVTLFVDQNGVYLGLGGEADNVIIADRVLDYGLSRLASEPDQLLLCSNAPTDYATAQSLKLAAKTYAAGGVFGSIGTGSPTGRAISTNEITDGAWLTNGTATHFAVIDSANTELLLRGVLQASVTMQAGDMFAMAPITVTITHGS